MVVMEGRGEGAKAVVKSNSKGGLINRQKCLVKKSLQRSFILDVSSSLPPSVTSTMRLLLGGRLRMVMRWTCMHVR